MSSQRPSKDSSTNRLYVEGADDLHVVIALIKRSGIPWDGSDSRIPFSPSASGDKDALSKAVVEVKAASSPRVGLILDADADPGSRWTQVCKAFAGASSNVNLPATYPDHGVVVDIESRRLGVWMMPYGGQSGAVETFLWNMVPDSPLRRLAERSTRVARTTHGACFPPKDTQKALVRTWLAWQEAPGAPYGRGIDLGYFPKTFEGQDRLIDWFRRVFLNP